MPDLHGNIAAQCTAAGSIEDVFRYDAYGNGAAWERLGLAQPQDLNGFAPGILKGGAVTPFSDAAGSIIHGFGCNVGLGQC